jgi:hypothetical protein
MQRNTGDVGLGGVRRQDSQFPAAEVANQPAQIQPDFDILCRGLVIIVEQVKNESSTVGFPSQLAQHVTARLQAEARPFGRGFGARHDS